MIIDKMSLGSITLSASSIMGLLGLAYAGGEKVSTLKSKVETVEQAVVQQAEIQKRLNEVVIDQAVRDERYRNIEQLLNEIRQEVRRSR